MPHLSPAQEQRRFRIPERDKLERQHAPKVERALREQITAVIDPAMSAAEIANAPNLLDQNSAELEAALLAFMLAMSDIGVDAAQDDLERVTLAVDPAEADELAKQLARTQAAATLLLLNNTTRRALQNAISAWLVQPERNVDDLLKELAPQMNRARATAITRTEGTAVFRQGVGVVGGVVGMTELEWYTMRDEIVCPICQPMQSKRRAINGQYESSLPVQQPPPAHPNCRCGELMVIRSIET